MSAVVETESEVRTSGDLPEGWSAATLGEIGDYLNGRAFKASEWSKSGRPIIRIQDLTGSKSKPNFFKGRVEERYVVRLGDFLISWAATLGAYIWSGPEGVLNQHIFKVHSKIDQKFHYYLANRILEELYQHTHGSGMVHITKGRFDNISVPIPPLAEQKRIVAKIKTLLARVNAARERLAKMPVILKRFRQAVLAAACSGRLTEDWHKHHSSVMHADEIVESIKRRKMHEIGAKKAEKVLEIYKYQEENNSEKLPPTWRYMTLDKLVRSFDYGTSAKSNPTGKVPVLRMGNIQNGRIDWSDLMYTSNPSEIKKYLLKPGTVLFNRTNSPELVGKTAIYRGEQPAIFAGYLIRVNNEPELNPEYLNCCLNTDYAREYCMTVKTDGVSQSNINAQKLAKFEIPFCSPEEQQEIVRRVDALYKLADTIEKRVAAATIQADRLTQAILAKAFRGELVPTEAELARHEGRGYETAAQLLHRIKSERVAITESKPPGAVSTAQRAGRSPSPNPARSP